MDLGGRTRGCVSINAIHPESPLIKRMPERFNASIGSIPHIYWDEKCALNKRLSTGTGTRHMLSTILSIIKKHFRWIKYMCYTDNSDIHCNGNTDVELYILYISLNGKTWYEKYFNGYIEDETLRNKYTAAIKQLYNPDAKIPFNILQDNITISDIDTIKTIYNSTTTYNDFFNKVLESVGREKYCTYVKEWVRHMIEFLFGTNFFTTSWIIDLSKITNIDFKTHNISPEEYEAKKIHFEKTIGGKKPKTLYHGPEEWWTDL